MMHVSITLTRNSTKCLNMLKLFAEAMGLDVEFELVDEHGDGEVHVLATNGIE